MDEFCCVCSSSIYLSPLKFKDYTKKFVERTLKLKLIGVDSFFTFKRPLL